MRTAVTSGIYNLYEYDEHVAKARPHNPYLMKATLNTAYISPGNMKRIGQSIDGLLAEGPAPAESKPARFKIELPDGSCHYTASAVVEELVVLMHNSNRRALKTADTSGLSGMDATEFRARVEQVLGTARPSPATA